MFRRGDLVWVKEKGSSLVVGWGLVIGTRETVLSDDSVMVDLVIYCNGRKYSLSECDIKKFRFMNSHVRGGEL